MITRILLLCTLFFFNHMEQLSAQSTQEASNSINIFSSSPTFLKYAKSTVDEPLLAVVNYSFDKGVYSVIDSNTYSWSGARTSQQQNIPFPEVNALSFDTSTHYNIYFAGSLDYNSRYLHTYTADGLVSENLRQSWVDGKWMNNYVENNIYSGKVLQEKISKTWNPTTSSWFWQQKEIYHYSSGVLVNVIYQSLNLTTSVWENVQSKSYFYAGTDTSEILMQVWDGFGWLNISKDNYSYHSGKLVSRVAQNWDTLKNVWENNMRWEYSFPSGLLESAIVSFWNDKDLTWQNSSRNVYTYSGTNLIANNSETWDNTVLGWQSDYKYNYEYYGANVAKMTIQYWDTITHSLVNNQQFVYEYNLKNALSKTSIYYWYAGAWNHPLKVGSSLRKYYYASTTSLLDEALLTNAAFITPNPVKEGERAYLNFEANSEGKVSIDLMNQLGQQIFNSESYINPGKQSISIPTDNLPAGMYMLKLKQNNKISQTFKLIKGS